MSFLNNFIHPLTGEGRGGYYNVDWDAEEESEAGVKLPTVTRLFYVSAGMVSSFRKHGQFIVMDATCKTNRFNMPLVLLVGLNDVRKSTIFAMGLVLVEDIVSYTWILNNVKTVMGKLYRTSLTCC
jgi:hypothetical protein